MQPIFHKRDTPCGSLALGNFISMMNWDMIDPTSVNVELLAQVEHRHRAAFDVPTGKSTSPGRVPFHLTPCRSGELPECEVSLMEFISEVNSLSGSQSLSIEQRKFAVIHQTGRIK